MFGWLKKKSFWKKTGIAAVSIAATYATGSKFVGVQTYKKLSEKAEKKPDSAIYETIDADTVTTVYQAEAERRRGNSPEGIAELK